MESERSTDCRQSLPILLLEERVWLWHDVAGPRFPISFSLAESCARGGNWVSLGEGIKQSQISCHWWQRLCSSAQPYGDTYGCAPGQHSSSWVSKVLFPTNDENEVWATAGEREKFIFFVCTKYIWLTVQFIAEDNAFSQPYGVTTHFIWKRADTHELAVIPLPHFLKGNDSRAIFEDERIFLEKGC